MKFEKMQAAGNDYIYINLFEENVEHPVELSRRLSDRHFGVGSDGLILIGPSDEGDFSMRMFNADGSEGRCAVMPHGAWASISMSGDSPIRERLY